MKAKVQLKKKGDKLVRDDALASSSFVIRAEVNLFK